MKSALLSFKLELQINAENYRFHEKQPRTCSLLLDSGIGREIWKLKTMATEDGQSGLSFVVVFCIFIYVFIIF